MALGLCLLLTRPGGGVFAGAIPFAPGEKLSYEIYWTVVHAGSASLEVLPGEELDGVRSLRFLAQARSTPFVDNFYKVRDRIEAWTDADVNRSLLYRKKQREGTYKKDVELRFDWGENKSYRYVRGELKHTLDQPDEVFDPLSILFSFRKHVLYKTMRFSGPVTDGKISVMGEAYVEGTEKVETPMGEIKCFRVRLNVKHLSGVFKKSKDAELIVWFSADERRLPVKVKSKVAVGHFSMELVDYRSAQSARNSTLTALPQESQAHAH